MRFFLAACQFLTILPWPKRADRSADEIGKAAVFFPLVGLVLGAVLVLINHALKFFFPAALLSLILVALLAWVTRSLHLDGLADTFDGLGAGGARERILKIMDDPRTGVFGVLAVVLVILFKARSIEMMDTERWRALLTAPLMGRWAMVLLAYRATAAKEGLGSLFIAGVQGRHLFVATLMAFVLVAGFSGVAGIGIMVWVALFTLACKYFFHHRLGGVTGDTFGAVEELSETSAVLLFALVQR
jgi:adenosylcobinamide-GDP ribazoletransferase